MLTRRQFLALSLSAASAPFLSYANLSPGEWRQKTLEESLEKQLFSTEAIGKITYDPGGAEYKKRISAPSGPLAFSIVHRMLYEDPVYRQMEKHEKAMKIYEFISGNKEAMEKQMQFLASSKPQARLSVVAGGKFSEGSRSDLYVHEKYFNDMESLPRADWHPVFLVYPASIAYDMSFGAGSLGYMDDLRVHPGTFSFMIYSRAHLASYEMASLASKEDRLVQQEFMLLEMDKYYGKAEIGAHSSLDRRLLAWCVRETERRAPESLQYPFVNDTLNRAAKLAKDKRDYNSPKQI